MKLRFSIKELFLATAIIAVCIGVLIEQYRQANTIEYLRHELFAQRQHRISEIGLLGYSADSSNQQTISENGARYVLQAEIEQEHHLEKGSQQMKIRYSISHIMLLLMALVAATANGQLPAKKPSPAEMEELHKKQAALLTKWNEGKVDPLDSNDLLRFISSIGDDAPADIPDNGTKVALNSLPAETQTDLHNAIAGLIRAYCSDLQTTAVIDYMKRRNEYMDPAFVDKVKSIVQQNLNASSDDMKAMSDDDLLRLFRGDDIKSHWAGVQQRDSTIQIWKTSEAITAKAQTEFGKQYWDIFPYVTRYVHAFRPTTFTDVELKTNGSLLVADVTLLIRLDETLLSKPSPYFIRFWFCTADKKWHPFQLVRCNVDDSTNNAIRTVF